MTDADVLAFVAATVKSVWTLELLLLLQRTRTGWRADQLVKELRASPQVVREGLAQLRSVGLVVKEGDMVRYGSPSDDLEKMVSEAARLYAAQPVAVIRAIASAPAEQLRLFSDAFRLKE